MTPHISRRNALIDTAAAAASKRVGPDPGPGKPHAEWATMMRLAYHEEMGRRAYQAGLQAFWRDITGVCHTSKGELDLPLTTPYRALKNHV